MNLWTPTNKIKRMLWWWNAKNSFDEKVNKRIGAPVSLKTSKIEAEMQVISDKFEIAIISSIPA